MKKGLIALGLLMASNATAQTCIPKPDCADMGYTKTSCSGAYLKCPFDTSKMACLADENAGRLCLVGYIYYSDGTCDSVVYSTKTPIGVVVKTNELVMSLNIKNMYWASSYLDVSGLTNYSSSTDAITDYNGKTNTAKIVSAYTSDTTSNNAAKYCNSYSTAGTSAGQWYLPAAGELYGYIYASYTTLEATFGALGKSLPSGHYWSSSEYNTYNAWLVGSSIGNVTSGSKDSNWSVSCCLLEISVGEESCSDTSCSVGNIMYSDGTCCKEKLDNKTAIGVVVKDNELVMSERSDTDMYWARSYVYVSGVTNYTSTTEALADYNG